MPASAQEEAGAQGDTGAQSPNCTLPVKGDRSVQPGRGRGSLRFIFAGGVCWCMFVNHYARDITGALEREIEADLGIGVHKFQALNSVYFAPNIISPILAGLLAQRIGAARMLVLVNALASLGHMTFALGGQLGSYNLLLAGRAMLGVTYESIDITPLPLLAPYFGDIWGSMTGMFNSALRMGSVTTFALAPVAYRAGGLPAAFWLSAIFGLSGLAGALMALYLEPRVRWVTNRRSEEAKVTSKVAAAEASLESAEDGTAAGAEPVQSEEKESVEEDSETASTDDGKTVLCACLTGDGAARELMPFVLYVTTGALMYTAIVPFWFSGGAFLQDKWGYSLQEADTLMLFPEGGMVLLSFPVGFLIDCLNMGVRLRALVLAASMLVVVGGFVLLTCLEAKTLPPIVPLAVLCVAWAVSNTILWSLTSHLVPRRCYALGAGILGSGLNVGPAVMPLLMAHMKTQAGGLLLLGGAAGLAAVGAVVLVLVAPSSREIASREKA